MKNRIKQTLCLAPAILLIFMWIVTAPSLIAQRSAWEVLAAAFVSALVVAWCVTLFAHALRRDLP
jgi:hypothetical protein